MRNSALKWLAAVIGRQRIWIFILLLIQAALGAGSVFHALLLRNIIDRAVEKDGSGLGRFLGGILLLTAMQLLLRAIARYTEEYARAAYENRLKGRTFDSLLKKDYARVTAVHSGEWMNRLTNDTVVCAKGLVEILPGVAGMLVKLSGALLLLLALEPKFAGIVLPGGGALVLLTYAFRKILKSLHKGIQEKDGALRVFLQENLESLLVVRAFAAEKQTGEAAARKMAEHKAARLKRSRFSNLCGAGFSAAMNGMYLLGVAYGGYGILSGTVSYGTLAAVLQLIGQIQSPFANLTGYLPRFYAMTASAERLMEAEAFGDDCPGEAKSRDEIRTFYREKFVSLVFEHADFTYAPPAGEEGRAGMPVVLRNCRLEIKKGEYVALTGHSGCGKTTLLKLMMCLYPLDGGRRFLRAGEEIPLTGGWHRLFAYVPQGNQLMHGTVREIVAFSDPEGMKRDADIRKALEIACAEEFVSGLEDGADTVLGEHGAGLSEGQMQRLAVARAVFSDAPILLLDEATSALDETTERKLLENLRAMTDKTVVLVTHRPGALEICGRIFQVTEHGIEWESNGKNSL